MITERIVEALTEALHKLGVEDIVPTLEHPQELSHGDYSTNIALAAAKTLGKNPRALAEEIVGVLGTIDAVEKVEIAGIGFINFHLTREFFAESTTDIVSFGEAWGQNKSLAGQRIMYEFTDPNPFKVFHIGHLMSNTIGEALARIAELSGATVIRANYQGDIGPHVARCLWAVQKENLNAESVDDLGKAYVIGSAAYEADPQAKTEIDSINKRLYANDAELKPLYDRGRKTSLDHFEDLYKVLGTKFDYYFFESEVGPIGIEVVMKGLESGVFEKSDSAIVYKGEKRGLHTRVFLTSQGTPTYETKELGLDKTKFEKEKLDSSIIVTAVEQNGFFEVVLAAMSEVLPDVAKKTSHVSHGMMQFATGKMSSRKGNVISGESLIEDMREQTLLKMSERDLGEEKQDTADAIAIAAIKYSVLKQATGKNIIFDPAASLSFEGDSGPYLQYSYVRAHSILKKAVEADISSKGKPTPNVSELERLLYRFPETIIRAQMTREPHHITTFLTECASAFNSWYAQGKIVDSSDETSAYKVALVRAFATTMKNGLQVLGMRAPTVM